MKVCFKCGKEGEFYKRPDNGKEVSYCKKCCSSYNKTRHSKNLIEERERSRVKHYVQKYGITWEDKVRMYEEQKGICACCFEPLPSVRDTKTCVDHNHETKAVRALVHRDCNWVIGWMEKHPKLSKFAIEYLKKFSV
jgi:Recombination endonuclease VII